MSSENLTAPTRTSVDFTHYFGQIADTLEWGSSTWLTFEEHLTANDTPFEALTLSDVIGAIHSTHSAHPHAPGTLVNRLIGVDDVSRTDLFRVIRELLRIYDLRIVELLALIDILEHCPGTVEDLTIRNLLALISVVDVYNSPLTPAAVTVATKAAAAVH